MTLFHRNKMFAKREYIVITLVIVITVCVMLLTMIPYLYRQGKHQVTPPSKKASHNPTKGESIIPTDIETQAKECSNQLNIH